MRQGLVLRPPDFYENHGPVVFLGGPIQGAPPWHKDAIDIIHDIDERIVIACPAKDYPPGEFVYEKQVDWETMYLNAAAYGEYRKRRIAQVAGGIMFWLAAQVEEIREEGEEFPRAYAQTTRQELGEWRNEKKHNDHIKMAVGIEKGFGNARYIRRRLEQDTPTVPILDNLEDTCRAITRLIGY